jgi:DNA-directed RNA polymerase specialized sigma24 family protein
VKTRAGKSDDMGNSRPRSDTVGKSMKSREPRDGPRHDQQLVERCLAGDVAAWEDIYAQCQDPLLALIKGMLRTPDASLIDEIAARVWYALVANDGAILTRFDPSRGNRLITFMRAIARDEAKRYFRAEVRRRERETIATRRKSAEAESGAPIPHFLVDEFLTTLSPGDRSFCLEHVLSAPQDVGIPTSRPAGWQQTRRLYKKLLAFLGREI